MLQSIDQTARYIRRSHDYGQIDFRKVILILLAVLIIYFLLNYLKKKKER
jgi:hypothetical protein